MRHHLDALWSLTLWGTFRSICRYLISPSPISIAIYFAFSIPNLASNAAFKRLPTHHQAPTCARCFWKSTAAPRSIRRFFLGFGVSSVRI